MAEKVACKQCGAEILVETAARTGGLCMPCTKGTREQIEASRRWNEERELRERDPLRVLWVGLVNRVYKTAAGFEGLSDDEKAYFAVGVLEGDLYNGRFEQYFFNGGASHYAHAVRGLREMGAEQALALLDEAKRLFFGAEEVPASTAQRRRVQLAVGSTCDEQCARLFERLDKEAEDIGALMGEFAHARGLVADIRKQN